MRKCVNCSTDIKTTPKTRKRKYCDICKLIVWKRQRDKNNKIKSEKRKLFNSQRNMKCVLCSISLPENCHSGKKYCNKCRFKKYYTPKHRVTISTKIIKLLKKRIIGPIDISKELNIPNGIIRTTIYNMRKSDVNILTVNDRYVIV